MTAAQPKRNDYSCREFQEFDRQSSTDLMCRARMKRAHRRSRRPGYSERLRVTLSARTGNIHVADDTSTRTSLVWSPSRNVRSAPVLAPGTPVRRESREEYSKVFRNTLLRRRSIWRSGAPSQTTLRMRHDPAETVRTRIAPGSHLRRGHGSIRTEPSIRPMES